MAFPSCRVAYHETALVASGPTVERATPTGSTLVVRFGNGGGLVLKPATGAGASGFAIAGPDHRFVWAQAEVRGPDLLLQAESLPHPVAVRYAWGNNRTATLYNQEGLPAPPFQAGE